MPFGVSQSQHLCLKLTTPCGLQWWHFQIQKIPQTWLDQWLPSLRVQQTHPEGLLKHSLLWLTPRLFESVGLGWNQGIHISNKSQAMPMLLLREPGLANHWVTQFKKKQKNKQTKKNLKVYCHLVDYLILSPTLCQLFWLERVLKITHILPWEEANS